MAAQWYILQSKPHKEEILWRRLRGNGYSIFYPRLFIYQKKTKTLKIRAFFPGYLFLHIDLDKVSASSFQWMPDSIGLVSFEEKPASISDQFIQAVQIYLKEISAQNERLLAGFDDCEQALTTQLPGESYQTIFDPRISGSQRVQALYRILREQFGIPY